MPPASPPKAMSTSTPTPSSTNVPPSSSSSSFAAPLPYSPLRMPQLREEDSADSAGRGTMSPAPSGAEQNGSADPAAAAALSASAGGLVGSGGRKKVRVKNEGSPLSPFSIANEPKPRAFLIWKEVL